MVGLIAGRGWWIRLYLRTNFRSRFLTIELFGMTNFQSVSATFSKEPFMPNTPLNIDLHGKIECARTIESKYYIDPTVLATEKAKIFVRPGN